MGSATGSARLAGVVGRGLCVLLLAGGGAAWADSAPAVQATLMVAVQAAPAVGVPSTSIPLPQEISPAATLGIAVAPQPAVPQPVVLGLPATVQLPSLLALTGPLNVAPVRQVAPALPQIVTNAVTMTGAGLAVTARPQISAVVLPTLTPVGVMSGGAVNIAVPVWPPPWPPNGQAETYLTPPQIGGGGWH